jgi:hypothetical protein
MENPLIVPKRIRSIAAISALGFERKPNPIDLALRITFFIVGPVPVMMMSFGLMALFELVGELITWNSSYYQDHRWCPMIACWIAGITCLVVWCRLPYFESGLVIGPLIIVMGFWFL